MMDDIKLLDKNSYLTFDGVSIKDIIIKRLNDQGILTDQNFQGSNLSALIDVISFTYSTLLYYLNKTSAESIFSESELYENLNRIVKILNYNPIGKIGQSVPYKVNSTLNKGNFVIPRYTYINAGGTFFSFPNDLPFTKFLNGFENIQDLNNKNILKQGLYNEKIFTAIGIKNEILFLSTTDKNIDHFGIDVYVKDVKNNIWEKWKKIENLFYEGSQSKTYELRLNQNKNYEIRFGDDINGKSLSKDDQICIFYLEIDPESPNIGPNSLNGQTLIGYNSLTYSDILKDTSLNLVTYLTNDNFTSVSLDNEFSSTDYNAEESIDNIKKNAPKIFKMQNRLITSDDFESYILANYPNFVYDVKVINNSSFLDTVIKYYYNIGLKNPQLEKSILPNNIYFSNSCNFNNIYPVIIPKVKNQKILTPQQKNEIIDDIDGKKPLTSNLVFIDPVYMIFELYYTDSKDKINIDDLDDCYLRIVKDSSTIRSDSSILSDVRTILNSYFSNLKLGSFINISKISTDLLSIEGIASLYTVNKTRNIEDEGLSFVVYNENYPYLDIKLKNQSFNLEIFQYPILKIDMLEDKIIIG